MHRPQQELQRDAHGYYRYSVGIEPHPTCGRSRGCLIDVWRYLNAISHHAVRPRPIK
jgi:hypothetical protein